LASPGDVRTIHNGANMSRIVLICCFTVLLGSCVTPSAANIDWEHARFACADVGLAPGSSIFDRCVQNLYYTLWQEQSVGER
jgi:hypothetical protein